MPLDARTINARELGRIVAEMADTAQAAWAGQPQQSTYQQLVAEAKFLRSSMNMVVESMARLQRIWYADELDAEVANHTIPTDEFSWETWVEQIQAFKALQGFMTAPIEIMPATAAMPAVSLTPNTIVSRLKPPKPYWGASTPPAAPPAIPPAAPPAELPAVPGV